MRSPSLPTPSFFLLRHWSIPLVLAACLAAACLYFNREWLCASRQWGSDPFCSQVAKEPEQRIRLLERRIKRNPGDAESWIQLALEWGTLDKSGS
ncbi:MAG: hypothetical protein RLZZ271_739, partial [Pseudomonadota bacterium]